MIWAWLRGNWHKLLTLLVSAILSGLVGFSILHYWHEAKKGRNRQMAMPIGIFEHDARLGYSHIANSFGLDFDLDYEVLYTIGKDKERFIPAPKKSLGRIVFLGDSNTFGQGVNDDQNYPYLLSRLWPDWCVVNKAAMGWGTSHAYLVLSDEMQRTDLPSLVIYAMIPHHITRNYIRKSWVKEIWNDRIQPIHPHFELIGGAPVFQGVINVTGSQEDYPQLLDKEIDLTRAFLLEMQKMCHRRRIPFVVIFLQALPPQIIVNSLVENNIPVLDLSGITIEGFPHDPHPNRNDHKRIAEAISTSFIAGVLKSLPTP